MGENARQPRKKVGRPRKFLNNHTSEESDSDASIENLANDFGDMSTHKKSKLLPYHHDNQENENPKSSSGRSYYESDASRLLRSKVSEDDDEKFHLKCSDEENKKMMTIKTIMVGSDYQAQVPKGLKHYDDALPYENEDKLLWDPLPLSNAAIETFLKQVADLDRPATPVGKHIKDHEAALQLLQQCGHNIEEAIRRMKMNKFLYEDPNQPWSEEECRNFEAGIRMFGKNFYLTQQNKVRTRSVSELVQFYYMWKKTERHDIFANKCRFEKKKYVLHPGVTDFMDRFLEEHEGRDSSSSPKVPDEDKELLKVHASVYPNMEIEKLRTMEKIYDGLFLDQ